MPRAATESNGGRIVVGTASKDGSLVIPSALRKELGIEPYDAFVMKVESNADGKWTISGKKLE